jgi:adenylate cyclase
MIPKHLKQGLQKLFSGNQSWGVGVVAGIVSLSLFPLMSPLERTGYKTLFQTRNQLQQLNIIPRQTWDKRIVVIGIDDLTLDKYGQFQTWSRERYVKLLKILQKSQPTAIGFDILFADKSASDNQLALAIEDAGTVVLARTWSRDSLRATPIQPVPELASVAANQGHLWHQAEADGTTRRSLVWVNRPNFSIPALGIAMLEVQNAYYQASGRSSQKIALPQPLKQQPQQAVWLNWIDSTQSVTTYSFADVISGKIKPEAFTDKLILVGMTATGGNDLVRTPFNFDPPTAGVYFHAVLIDNLLNQRLLNHPPNVAILPLLPVITLLSSFLILKCNFKQRSVLTLLLPGGWFVIATIAFSGYGWWLPVAAPITAIMLSAAGIQLREQLEKQQLMQLFEQHIAPETAQLIWQRKNEIFDNGQLQAQEMTATILFMDIRNFTSISEKLTPSQLLEWLNSYLTVMSDCIMDCDGVIDKYIGDAIMAVFGVPFTHTQDTEIQQDAKNAIAASLAMHQKLQQLNRELQAKKLPKIQFGIGIHTGTVVAGTVGSSRRLNYSVLGDAVNVASRLESMNKELTVNQTYNLLVTGETFKLVCESYTGILVKTVQLRGREHQTEIYCITGEK